MSRIGKAPIEKPEAVTVNVTGLDLVVKGPKGELSMKVRPEVKIEVNDNQVIVTLKKETKKSGAFWGLTRALIANMIIGVMEGYEKKLELVGVGYRASQISPNEIEMTLGFSHPVKFKASEGIELKVEDNQHITISGLNKQLVGLTAAKIRKIKKPEPYKGKGIRYEGEIVRRKPGKVAKVGAGGIGS